MENPDSEQTNSQNAGTRIKQLTEINEKLNAELQNLKKEYAQSLNVIPDLQKVYSEVNTLKMSLCEYQSKNDDLQKRLDIALKANAEMMENCRNSDSPTDPKQYEKELIDLNMNVNKLKSENDFLKNQYKSQLRNYESSLYQSQSETAQLQSNVSKLLKAAECYFSNHFENIQNLTTFLNESPQKTQKVDAQIIAKNKEIQELIDKVKHLKEKYRNEKQKVKTLQIGVLKLKKKAESDELEVKEQITLLQDKNNQQENEIKRLKLYNEQRILEEKALHRHKNQMTQFSSVEEESRLNLTFKRELESATSLINENETTISSLRKELEDAQNQILQNDMVRSQLSLKLQNANSDIEDLQNQLQKQKQINEQLSLAERKKRRQRLAEGKSDNQSNTESEEYSKEQIEREQIEKELTESKEKIDNLQQANKHLGDLLQNQKDEIEDLCNAKDKLITVIEQQSILYNNLEKSMEENQNNKPKIIEKEIAVEPKFEWQFGRLPSEISDIVNEIGENDSLSIESRIKSIFTVINKYIENEQNAHKKEKDEFQQTNKEIGNEFEEYKNSIVEAFNKVEGEGEGEDENKEKSIEPDEAPKMISEVLAKNKKMENELATLNNQNQKLFTEADCESFDVAFEKYKTMNDNLKRKSTQLKEERKKRSTMRKQMTQVLATKDKELEQKTSTLKKINENSRNQINQLQSQLDKLTEQNKNLINQMLSASIKKKHKSKKRQVNFENNENNENNENSENSINNNNNNKANHENNEATELYTQFDSQLDSTHLRFQVDDLSDQINNLNREINLLKQALKEAQKEALHQKAKNDELKKKFEEEMLNTQSNNRKEKAQLQSTIDDLAGKMLVEKKDNREAVNNLNESLLEKEKQIDQLNQQVMNLKFENEKAQMSAESKIEALDRSKKLSDCQYKAKILSIESKHAIDLEEQKRNNEKNKRDLIEYFIKNFSSYSNMNDQLDEDTFKETVRKVKNQFDKCQKREIAIRKLIKAKDRESTDDALTQFIIRMHPQFQS